MILVDSNVLIDLMRDDPQWGEWSLQQLRRAKSQGRLAINIVIYAEIAVAYPSPAELDVFLEAAGIGVKPVSTAAAFAASQAFLRYRKAKGGKTGVLPDFFIGAQAQTEDWPLLTRDAARYRTYFPQARLIAP